MEKADVKINQKTLVAIKKKIDEILDDHSGLIEVDIDNSIVADIYPYVSNAYVRRNLARKGIFININKTRNIIKINKYGFNGKEEPKKDKKKQVNRKKQKNHTFMPPFFHEDVLSIITDDVPVNLWFVGSTGSGKTAYVEYLCETLGRKLYQIDGRRDLDNSSFFGSPTVKVDKKTKQNFITWQDGKVIKAMQEGLDKDGKEVGPPAILFIDEAASIPAHLMIGFNRLLGSKKPKREISIDGDGGRTVVSHSGMRVICAANTIGRGLTGLGDAEYHAQADGLDLSTLRRFGAVFKFGYSDRAERNILYEKVVEDDIIEKIIKLRDAYRSTIKNGRTSTPFSTRDIVDIADQYRILGDLSKALYYSVFTKLQPEEVAVYNEQTMAVLGTDILQMVAGNNDMDYMN